MEKKQSSIEWFAMMLADQGLLITKDYENLITYKEAKAMHKEEIIESYCNGCLDMTNDDTIFPRETSEQYYNETFGDEEVL